MEQYGERIAKIEALKQMPQKEKEANIKKILSSDFIDLTCDYGMKFVFRNLDLLKMLLEDVLGATITEIEHLPDEILGSRYEDKHIIMDIGCIIDGRRAVVEMQSAKTDDLRKRFMYYGAMLITDQLPRGAEVYDYKDVHVIAFLNTNLIHLEDQKRLYYRYKMIEESTHELYDTSLIITLCELPNLLKQAGEEMTPLEQWYYYFRNMKKFSNLAGGPVVLDNRFNALIEACRTKRLDDETEAWFNYIAAMLTEREKQNLVAPYFEEGLLKGRKEGREEGRTEGREEGRTEGRLEIARTMLADGVCAATVSKYTGLSEDEIAALK